MTYKEESDLYNYYKLGKIFQWFGLSQFAYRCFRISKLCYENVEFRTRDYGNVELALFGDKLDKNMISCFQSLSHSVADKIKSEENAYKNDDSFFVGYSVDWHEIVIREKNRIFQFYN